MTQFSTHASSEHAPEQVLNAEASALSENPWSAGQHRVFEHESQEVSAIALRHAGQLIDACGPLQSLPAAPP